MNMKLSRAAGALTLAIGFAAAMGLPAQAKAGGGESAHGTCSATSTWKLNASGGKKDTIKVKAKVDSGVAGELWLWTVSDNGSEVAAGESTTDGDGKFKVKQTIADLEGDDTISFTATDTVTGETCIGEVVFDK